MELQDLSECRDKALAGGKAVNLGILIRAGFNVPGGFVVTTAGYRAGRGIDLRQRSHPLAGRILEAWRAMGGVPVAVRSSATAEDMAEASMAGQYDTFLDIATEDALLDAIQKCWASLDSPRTRSYLAEHGIDLRRVAMAVVVQRLVPSDVSGVMFSANPQTGSRREMLVEASWGLGEAVVSGRVQPDVLLIDRETGRVVQATVADKQIWIKPGEHDEKLVEDERRQIACLKSADVEKLWKLGLKAAQHFGAEQDMEWGISNGELFLLQSRPITTLAQAEAYEQLLQSTREHLRRMMRRRRGPWVLHNISETLKHPTPLTWSIIKRFMSGAGGFGAMYRQAGFAPSERVCTEGFLERIAGKVYMDLAMGPEMFFEGYPFKYDVELLRSNPDASQAPPTVPSGSALAMMGVGRRVGAVNVKVHAMAQDLDQQLNARVIPAFVAWCREEKKRDLARLSAEEFIILWREREQKVMEEFAPQSLLPSMVSGMALSELRAFLDENFWDEDPDHLSAMLGAAHPPDKTLLANAEMYQVAQGKRTAQDWLGEYGHRAPDEFDLATPRWRERPDELAVMANRLKGGQDPLALHEAQSHRAEAKLRELKDRLSAEDAAELERLVDLTRRYLGFRETGKFYLMLGYDLLRDLALEAGRRLDIREGVFQLTEEELFDALRVGFAPNHLITQRMIVFEAESRVSLPAVIDEDAIPTLGQPAQVNLEGAQKAFPLSTGIASGPARIVFSPESAGELGTGYILVCPSTDPGWTPLFVNAAGLVLECGGSLSHGAVVAREMNIPAVVVPGATRSFAEGEVITVDGRGGAVSRGMPSDNAAQSGPSADDTRIPRELVPPPPGRFDRWSAQLRNVTAVFWGVFLALLFLLPENWLYWPTFKFLDLFLWPVTRVAGKAGVVVFVAALVATATMVCQKFLTDNGRLREAKRRANLLEAEALKLPRGTPRRQAMLSMAMPVQMRVAMAAMVPLAVLLGPMVLTFMWFPIRVDPAAANAAPGTGVDVIANVEVEHWDPKKKEWVQNAGPVTVTPPQGFAVGDFTPAKREIPPVRSALERQRARWSRPSDVEKLPWDLQAAAKRAREEMMADLDGYLSRGVPPYPISWHLDPPKGADGRFPVTVEVGGLAQTIYVVMGNRHAPELSEVEGQGLIRKVQVKYPPPKERVEPVWRIGKWEMGWLLLYLIVYLPVMFGVRWLLGVV